MTLGRRKALATLGLGLAAALSATSALARCEGVTPGQRPQNTPREDVGQDLDEIIDRGFLEVAVYEDYKPYSWEEAGQPKGVDVEVGRIIAAALGVEARIRFVEAGENLDADLFNYVWKGSLIGGHVSNLLMRVPYNSDYACRVDQVAFTGQYAAETISIAYRVADYPDGGPKPAYFRYDTVAVENDSIADFYLTSLVGAAQNTIHRYPTTARAMEALAAGEVMAAMGPESILEAGVTPDLAVHHPPLPGFSIGTWTVGTAVHQSHRDLGYAVDDAISAALADGRIAKIYADYGLTFQPPER
jgi:ABC-type amino acid transport substrate-binding protein